MSGRTKQQRHRRAALADAAAGLFATPGECWRCEEWSEQRITVGIQQSASGPGWWSRYACVPCARILARSSFAPDWLTEDLATLDASAKEAER